MSTKADARAAIAGARAAMTDAQRDSCRAAIRAAVLAWCATELPAGSRIAAYEPLRTEPGSTQLLRELAAAGHEVIVPRTLPDRDLDWVRWTPAAAVRELLGVAAVGAAELVLTPAFAVDRAGNRLGRGGGSYDRALGRVEAGVSIAALIYASELLEWVPTDPWDRPVTAAVSQDGWILLTPGGRRNSP